MAIEADVVDDGKVDLGASAFQAILRPGASHSSDTHDVFAKSDTSSMAADRLASLGSHKHNSQQLADSRCPARIGLDDIDCIQLE
jgi:hypothetical protein